MSKDTAANIMPARIEVNGVWYINENVSYEISAKSILINAMRDDEKTPEELEALASVAIAISHLRQENFTIHKRIEKSKR